MTSLARALKWLLRAAIFFTLFAFALNNPHLVQVNFFFGHFWLAPLVLLVLAVFALGVCVGALGMAPRWWRKRQAIPKGMQVAPAVPAAANPEVPRHGL